MEPTQILSLTQKGLDEIKTRIYKLNMKKRSVLILLDRPQTVQYLMERCAIGRSEAHDEIVALAAEGFLVADRAGSSASAAPATAASAPVLAVAGKMAFSEDIILSEAKFLMSDFCVNVFGTASQQFVDGVGQCKSVPQFTVCAQQVYDATKAKHPNQLKTLEAVFKEIRDTAL